MLSGDHGQLELCPDAVRAGDQHRLLPFLCVHREQRAKSTDAAEDARREGPARVVADALLRGVRDCNVHSGVGIFHGSPDGISFSYERTNIPVVLFREKACVPPGGFGNTCSFLLGDNQPKKSGTISSSAPGPDAPARSRKQKNARESGRAPKRPGEHRATYISSPAYRGCLCAARAPRSGCHTSSRGCRPSRNKNCPGL